MTDIEIELASTLAYAAETYRELVERGVIPTGIADLLALAAERDYLGSRIEEAVGSKVASEASPTRIGLGDWRKGTSAEALILQIERDLIALAERAYFAPLSDRVKAAVEDVHAASSRAVEALNPRSDRSIEEQEFALHVTPFDDHADWTEWEKGASFGDGDKAGAPPQPDKGIDLYPVWYGTNRAPVDPDDMSKGFGRERSATGTSHGRCLVHVPKSHRIGSLGSGLLTRVRSGVDDRLSVHKLETIPADQFWRELDGAAEDERDAVVFVHGYNVSFENAALRAAQIGVDLGVNGPMAFFSWPSKGRLMGYFADGNSIEASEPDIVDFLVTMATQPNVRQVHVIAHSMGNRGVLAAITRIAAMAGQLSGRRFGQFLLAAADVDAEVFQNKAGACSAIGTSTTLYVSPSDFALNMASRISAFPRAGRSPPVSIVDGIDTIDVGRLEHDFLGHGYVAEDRSVLSDMHHVITTGASASSRFGLEEQFDDKGRRYWTFRR